MFDALRNALSHEQKRRPRSSGHTVTDPYQINYLLGQAYHSHTLLNASFAGQKQQFTTALLGIYQEHGFLVLDELTPERGHKLFLKQQEIDLFGRIEGVELRFKTELIEAKEKGGVAFYKAKMPEKLFHLQRRLDHRVKAGGARISFQAYLSDGAQLLRGYVYDLSRKGVGLIVEDEVTINLGDKLEGCKIVLPEEGDALFSLEVRFSSRNNQRKITRIGGCFLEVDPESLQKIRKAINIMERNRAQRMHGF